MTNYVSLGPASRAGEKVGYECANGVDVPLANRLADLQLQRMDPIAFREGELHGQEMGRLAVQIAMDQERSRPIIIQRR